MTTAAAADTEKAKKKLGHIRLLQHVANGLLATRKVREALPIFTSIVGLLQTDVDFGPKHRETGAALVHKAACLNLLGCSLYVRLLLVFFLMFFFIRAQGDEWSRCDV